MDECAVQRADAPAVGAPIAEGSEQENVEEPARGFADQRGCVMAVNAHDLVCANYLVVKRAQPHICQAHRVLLAAAAPVVVTSTPCSVQVPLRWW